MNESSKPESITVLLDAGYDLAQAGYDLSQADDFAVAYRAAAKLLSDATGIEVRVEDGDYGEVDEDSDQVWVWQALHDATRRGDDGVWRPDLAVIADRAGRLLRSYEG